jgi:hypothetical protein
VVRVNGLLIFVMFFICVACGANKRGYQLRLIIRHDFRGDLLIETFEDTTWNPSSIYTLDGRSGKIKMPRSAFDDTIAIKEVVDENGNVLSRELQYNEGDIGITEMGFKNDQRFFRIGPLK